MSASGTFKGVIRGRIVELEQSPGLPDGQPVTVQLEAAPHREADVNERLEALKRASGGWADDPESVDRFLEWNKQQRKTNRREMPE